MPRSATGWTDAGSGGYTLIELLVVLVIAGVLAGVAILRLGEDGPEQRLADQIDRLDARLEALCDRALLTGRPHGVRATGEGYDFWVRQRQQWVTLPESERPGPARWPDEVRARLVIDGRVIAPTTAERPQLVCSALEPFLPFEWELSIGGQRARFVHPRPSGTDRRRDPSGAAR